MPALARRRYPERHECWHVYYGDIHAGTIALPMTKIRGAEAADSIQVAILANAPIGSAPTFDDARADFEAASRVFLLERTEADFQGWREAQAWTAWKYKCGRPGTGSPPNRPVAVHVGFAKTFRPRASTRAGWHEFVSPARPRAGHVGFGWESETDDCFWREAVIR
jgi:hypothetical protein